MKSSCDVINMGVSMKIYVLIISINSNKCNKQRVPELSISDKITAPT